MGVTTDGSNRPRPYQRPSIDLTGHGKTWQDVAAQDVEEGDLVMGQGKVLNINHYQLTSNPPISKVQINFLSGAKPHFNAHEQLRVFTRQRS